MRPSLRYQYRAARADGLLIRGEVRATTAADASARLLEQGLSPIQLTAAAERGPRRSMSRREQAVAFRSVASLVAAGLPLERAIAATEPICRSALRSALAEVRADLTEGLSLSAALERRDSIFSTSTAALLRAGERASRLPDALEQVAAQLEREAELLARLRAALAYPLVLAIGGLFSVGLIAVVVVPRFAALLADLGQDLPRSTALLLFLSSWLASWWWLLFALMAVVGLAMASWTTTDAGRVRWHAALLRLPLVGRLRLSLGSVRWLRALGGALSAGMPVAPALQLARDACGDAAIAARLARATERVHEGRPLGASLAEHQALTPLGLQLLTIGESSGTLATMAERAATVLSLEVERQLNAAVRLLEPLLIVGFGGFVAFVAAALLQAVYGIRPTP